MRRLPWLLLVLCLTASAAIAGPNAGGVLLVHDTGLAYSTDTPGPPYEGPVPIDCSAIDNEAPLGSATDQRIWKVYAAFPPGSSPRLQGLSWGIGLKPFGGGYVSVTTAGLPNAGDFEVTMDGPGGPWPVADSSSVGESFPISGTKTSLMTEVYWFAGYAYGGPSGADPQGFAVHRHRVQDSMFVDDASPPNKDGIAAFGTLGFGQAGTSPCPELPPPTGACCAFRTAYGSVYCAIETQAACLAAGGTYRGDNATCLPLVCGGACCTPSGACTVTAETDCATPNVWHSTWSTCDPGPCLAPDGGSIVAWGENNFSVCNVPAPNSGFMAVAGGDYHSLGLKSDGTIAAWGFCNDAGQCNVPAPNADFVAVAAGDRHSLGIKSDGRIVAWGWNAEGQCNVPQPNAGFVAAAGGWYISMGLRSDRTVVVWGYRQSHWLDTPAPNADFLAIAAGAFHCLGLKSDGTIVAWGRNTENQCNVPTPNSSFIAVAAGEYHSLGLKSDGRIVAWGDNRNSQCNVPSPNAGFVAVAGGRVQGLGLRPDRTILAWGADPYSIRNHVPDPNSDFVAVAAGGLHNLGLRSTRTVPGACCAAVGTCALILQADCQAPSVWHGVGISCTPNPCPLPPTPVLLESWAASSLTDGLRIRWEVPLGGTGAQYRAWRDPAAGPHDVAPTPEAVLVSTAWVSASAEGITETMDRGAPRGTAIRYFLEMSTNGAHSEFLGPVEARWDPPALAWSVGPTPFRGAVRLTPPGPGPARAVIFDPAGRLVRTLDRSDGNTPLEWDGRSDTGREAPTGIYLARLTAASGDVVRRLVKVE